MVEDIKFTERIPVVSASGRVNKVNRKKREDEKPPFEKYLDPEDKKKKKRKKESDKVDIHGKAENQQTQDSSASPTLANTKESEDESDEKIIDVRV